MKTNIALIINKDNTISKVKYAQLWQNAMG